MHDRADEERFVRGRDDQQQIAASPVATPLSERRRPSAKSAPSEKETVSAASSDPTSNELPCSASTSSGKATARFEYEIPAPSAEAYIPTGSLEQARQTLIRCLDRRS